MTLSLSTVHNLAAAEGSRLQKTMLLTEILCFAALAVFAAATDGITLFLQRVVSSCIVPTTGPSDASRDLDDHNLRNYELKPHKRLHDGITSVVICIWSYSSICDRPLQFAHDAAAIPGR